MNKLIEKEFSLMEYTSLTREDEPKISDNFYYHELFSKGMYQKYSTSLLLKLIDFRIVNILETIRSDFNSPILVNNWFWKGSLKYRGFRPMSTDIGAKFSQHKFGRAVDFNVKNLSDDAVREFILRNEKKYYDLGLSRIENGKFTTSWIHIDLLENHQKKIIIFNP